jgi:hypothetical protein
MAGRTKSNTSISTAGSHQTAFFGGEAFLARFSSDGLREWGTYYGQNGYDDATALAVDPNGDIVMAGVTDSFNYTFIATAGSHQAVFGGGYDAFLVRFTSGGVRLWGTYYGRGDRDFANAVAVTSDGDILMAGMTESTASISTAGSHQAAHGGSVFDAFLVRFTSGGVREWGTYYGGSGRDEATSLAVAANGDIVMAGNTSSSTAIATTDSHQVLYGGETDAFLVRFTSDGVRKWGTYYGGSGRVAEFPGGSDRATALAVAANGDVVIAGYSESDNAIATAGSHQAVRGEGYHDAFLARFTSGGVREWGTYYGGRWNDFARALAVAANGDIVMAGETWSNNAIATAGSHQGVYGGGSYDAFLAVFRDDGSTSVTPDQAPEYVPSIRSIQPNPAAGSVTVVCSGTSAGTIDIVDVQGRILRSTLIDAGTTSVPISIADLAPGSYQVRFMSNVSSASGALKASVQALVVVP